MRANLVRFSPRARTDWHSHAMGQTLHIVSGIALIQARGGRLIKARPGDTVYTPPGEEHWHGATAARFMTHLAMLEVDDAGNAATWGDHVTDEEYAAANL